MPEIKISSILGGMSPTKYFASEGQYQSAIGIDPEQGLGTSNVYFNTIAGILRPIASSKFSSTALTGPGYWIVTAPETGLYYVLARVSATTHKLISYTSVLGTETEVASTSALSAGQANGLVYYNNYLYIFGNTDIDRYGPLSGSPTLTKSWWVGTLGKTALTNTSYPSLSAVVPNHMGYVLSDNKLYFCDYVDGRGIIHFIKTKKTTTVGDTDDGSTYNALDLPFGFKPTCLSEWEDNLVIGAMNVNSNGSGDACLFFWDTVSDSFYRQVRLTEPIVTALKNTNGNLYVWAGMTSGARYSVLEYLGGMSTRALFTFIGADLPIQGAVDASGNRIYWGHHTRTPGFSASVLSYGSIDERLPKALHNVAKSTAVADLTTGQITCLKHLHYRGLIMGWVQDTNYGLDGPSSTYQTHVWRSAMFNLEKPFHIKKIEIPLGIDIGTNMSITPKLYMDDESSVNTLTTINPTNFTGRRIQVFPDGATGKNNFFLELTWTGTALCPVLLPIKIEFDYKDL